MGIEDPYELTGLYDGIALTERSVMHQPTRPDAVWLYRRPILEEWIDRGDVALDRLVPTCWCTRSPTTSAGPTTTSAPSTTGPSEPATAAEARESHCRDAGRASYRSRPPEAPAGPRADATTGASPGETDVKTGAGI